jgi:hypothetical protein
MIEKIIKTVFPDGNYLGYYPRLIMGSLSQARLLVGQGDCERAMEKLRDFAAYARGFEKLMGKSGYLSYTSPVLDHWGESAEGLGRLSGSGCGLKRQNRVLLEIILSFCCISNETFLRLHGECGIFTP